MASQVAVELKPKTSTQRSAPHKVRMPNRPGQFPINIIWRLRTLAEVAKKSEDPR